MGVIVTFSQSAFLALFPQFSYLNSGQLQGYFNLATQFCRNDGGGPVCDMTTQTNLLNLATAHVCQLFAPTSGGQTPTTLVGRTSNASEGSVSVATENQYAPGTVQWWQQTPFGSAFWVASQPFRTMRYLPGPRRSFYTSYPYGRAWGGGW